VRVSANVCIAIKSLGRVWRSNSSMRAARNTIRRVPQPTRAMMQAAASSSVSHETSPPRTRHRPRRPAGVRRARCSRSPVLATRGEMRAGRWSRACASTSRGAFDMRAKAPGLPTCGRSKHHNSRRGVAADQFHEREQHPRPGIAVVWLDQQMAEAGRQLRAHEAEVLRFAISSVRAGGTSGQCGAGSLPTTTRPYGSAVLLGDRGSRDQPCQSWSRVPSPPARTSAHRLLLFRTLPASDIVPPLACAADRQRPSPRRRTSKVRNACRRDASGPSRRSADIQHLRRFQRTQLFKVTQHDHGAVLLRQLARRRAPGCGSRLFEAWSTLIGSGRIGSPCCPSSSKRAADRRSRPRTAAGATQRMSAAFTTIRCNHVDKRASSRK